MRSVFREIIAHPNKNRVIFETEMRLLTVYYELAILYFLYSAFSIIFFRLLHIYFPMTTIGQKNFFSPPIEYYLQKSLIFYVAWIY